MNQLLLDDYPLIILPSLAEKIGLNESIVLQQLHYWLKKSDNIQDNYKWVYNTYEDWQKQFPFWSVSTIRRTITKLENMELVIIGNYNKLKIDNTKWYRIDYQKLAHMSRPPVQNEQTDCSKWTDDLFKMNRPLPETTTETTSETNKKHIDPSFTSSKKPTKKKLTDYVSMTEEEYQKLVEQFGQKGTDDRIENLSLYKGSTGKKYKSDYLTILNWERKNNKGGGDNRKPAEDVYSNLF